MKINLFKKENSFKKKEFTFHTNFYWKIILLCAFVMISFSFVFGYYLFIQTSQESILPTTNNDMELFLIKKNNLEKVLNSFSEREKKSIEILNSSVPVVDPSL